MKTNCQNCIVIWVTLLLLSCKDTRELKSRSDGEAPESATPRAGSPSELSGDTQNVGANYGRSDIGGGAIDPRIAMNSDSMAEAQRLELRQPLPDDYRIGETIVPRCVVGKANDIQWRKVGDQSFNPGNRAALAKLLGLDLARMPSDIRDDDWVLKSPSGGRVMVHSGGSSDHAVLFEVNNGTVDVSSGKAIHCINFDDKRRAFIFWDSFASENLIVGHLVDDEDLEDLPSRQILYAFNIRELTLCRVAFPKEVQEEEWMSFVVDCVAPSAVLLRWDGRKELVTVYLD